MTTTNPDTVTVPVIEYSMAMGPITVSIDDWDDTEGSRKNAVPTILVQRQAGGTEVWHVALTWDEARALAAALTEVTDIAENG